MGAGHGHRLHYHGHSPLHRAQPHLKIIGLLAFVLVVVATPREWFLAYAFYLAVLLGVIAVSRVPFGYLLPRLVVELPFVVFAVLLPFIAHGPQVDVLGLSLSEPGLLAAWGLLAKGTLDPSPLVTDTVGLDGVADAFERLATPDTQAKILVDPAR